MTRRLARIAAALAVGALSFGYVAGVVCPREALAQVKGGGAHEDISLAVGETRTLSAVGVKEYSEGVKGIVDVVPTPDGRTFVLTGKKPGSTTLLLIRQDGTTTTYEIAVANRNPQLVEKEVQQLMEGIPGLRTRRIGSRVFIEGGVSTDAELKRVQQIASLYGGQVEVLAERGSVAERKLLIRLDFFFVQYERTSGYNVGLGWPTL
jgi:pilus assembly protein CpaC